MIDQARLEFLEENDTRILYGAQSWSAPARRHLIELAKDTGTYTCSCPGFTYHDRCHHVLGWAYQELGSAEAQRAKAKRERTPRPAVTSPPNPSLGKLGPAPPLYRDVIADWTDHRAVFMELLHHDETFRAAVARADVNVMTARLWRIMLGIRVVPPQDYQLTEALHEAPPTSSIARWGRFARADPALSQLLPQVDPEEQQRRAEGVKLTMTQAKHSGAFVPPDLRGQQAFEVEP